MEGSKKKLGHRGEPSPPPPPTPHLISSTHSQVPTWSTCPVVDLNAASAITIVQTIVGTYGSISLQTTVNCHIFLSITIPNTPKKCQKLSTNKYPPHLRWKCGVTGNFLLWFHYFFLYVNLKILGTGWTLVQQFALSVNRWRSSNVHFRWVLV